MPRIAQELPDSRDAITRPVALDTARQLGALLKLPKSTQILIPGITDQAAQTGSTLNYEGEPVNFPFNGRVLIELNSQYVEERVLSDVVYQNDAPLIFNDSKLGVRLKPVYSSNELSLSIRLRTRDKVAADRFRDDIKMRTSMMRKENLHEITYHYGIPVAFQKLLKQIHCMREKVAGYGDSFETWLKEHLTCRATHLTTLKGTEPLLVIPEHQVQVLGWFDFTTAPENPEKDGEGTTYTSSFEYRIQFDKVIGVVAEWPLVIHNQVIPLPWRGKEQATGKLPNDPAKRSRRRTSSREAYDHFVPKKLYDAQPIDGLRYPGFDDWYPYEVAPDTSTVYQTLLMVDVSDPTMVLNLYELADVSIDHDILAYLKGEGSHLTRLGESAVFVSLYKGRVPVEGDALSVDAGLTIRSRVALDPREVYHLRIALQTDLLSLSQAALERLRSAGCGALKLILTLQERFPFGNKVPKLLAGKYIPKALLKEIAANINAAKVPYQTGVEYRFLTVGNFLITTQRSDAYALHENLGRGEADREADTGEGVGPSEPVGDHGQPIRPCR